MFVTWVTVTPGPTSLRCDVTSEGVWANGVPPHAELPPPPPLVVPAPDKLIISGELLALLAMLKPLCAETEPDPVGVKVTRRVMLWFELTVMGTARAAIWKGDRTSTLDTVTEPPVAVSVILWGALVAPTLTLPKLSVEGLAVRVADCVGGGTKRVKLAPPHPPAAVRRMPSISARTARII